MGDGVREPEGVGQEKETGRGLRPAQSGALWALVGCIQDWGIVLFA
jgi:hypothetical protein